MRDTLVHRWLKIPFKLHVHWYHRTRRSRVTIVLLHGMGNSSETWQSVVAKLPHNANIVSIDLLGYGQSSMPEWAIYNVATQARAVIRTLLAIRPKGKVILVGHSLGALVSIEVAKRYPVIVRSLILCSPPIYDLEKDKVRLVNAAFKRITNRPDRFVKIVSIAKKYKLVNQSFSVTEDSIHSYIETLRASILTQTSLEDVIAIKKPITFIHGSLDPWVKKRNLQRVVRENDRAILRTVRAGHEVRGLYIHAVVRVISKHMPQERVVKRK